MALGFWITNAVAQGMLNGTGLAEALGSQPKIRIFAGTVPTDADATPSSPTQLGELLCASTPLASFSDQTQKARATFGTIGQDTSADATGTAAYFRIYDNAGTTVKCQGTVGVGTFDLVLNTASITSGSVISISSAYIELPEG